MKGNRVPWIAVLSLVVPGLFGLGTFVGKWWFEESRESSMKTVQPRTASPKRFAATIPVPAQTRKLRPRHRRSEQQEIGEVSSASRGEDVAAAREEAIQILMAEVRAEPVDIGWARAAEIDIRDSIEPESGLDLQGVECRSRRRVVEAIASGRAEAESLRLSLVANDDTRRGRLRLTNLQNGGVRVRAILARNGYLITGAPDASWSKQGR